MRFIDSRRQFVRTATRQLSYGWWLVVLVMVGLIVFAGWFYYALTPPVEFPAERRVDIPAGSNLMTIAEILHENNLIRSQIAFLALATLRGEATKLKAGTYQFSEPYPLPRLLTRLAEGDYFNDLLRFTHVEGWSNQRLAEALADSLEDFDPTVFLSLAEPYEGKLFPDTYYVPRNYSEASMVELLHNHYQKEMRAFSIENAEHSLSESEIIILASILEREANTFESKRTVSGILQNRLAIDMPLQADATLEYVLDKPLSELTASDLELESPYNTYLNRGLPPTPIGNPGRSAIQAVVDPIHTSYFYYITGVDGEFYYAEDFDTHRDNINRYLRL